MRRLQGFWLGHLPGYDEALAALIRHKEGAPPQWFERLIAPFFHSCVAWTG